MRKAVAAVFICFAISSCSPPDKSVSDKPRRYFDLTGYFGREAVKLARLNPLIEKSVQKNEIHESRRLGIKNWQNELSLFSSSDINKPALQDSYHTHTTGYKTVYTATDPKLRTREITVITDPEQDIKYIGITNKTDNALYSSSEKLDYYPDSLYQISKQQHVILLGNNNYLIKGKFNHRHQ